MVGGVFAAVVLGFGEPQAPGGSGNTHVPRPQSGTRDSPVRWSDLIMAARSSSPEGLTRLLGTRRAEGQVPAARGPCRESFAVLDGGSPHVLCTGHTQAYL